MSLIHPSQIDEVNKAFTLTIEELDYCRRVVQAFDDARFAEKDLLPSAAPIVDRAPQTLALAESLGI
jgi:citrate lyase beta subunit